MTPIPAASIAAGLPAEALAARYGVDAQQFAAARAFIGSLPWQYVTAGGVTQAVGCIGSGGPTVVYVNGLIIAANWSWPLVAEAQATTNRVCLIDRAGTGVAPARARGPNSPVLNATELVSAMRAAGEPGPYLAVGWSYGGLVARTAAAVAPADIVGLVLVDSVTPAAWRTYDPNGWTEGGTPLDMGTAEAAITAQPSLSPRPVVVLQAGQWFNGQPAPASPEQAALASASDNSVFALVPGVGHTIPQQAPATIVAATTAATESITDGRPMPACPAALETAGAVCQERPAAQ